MSTGTITATGQANLRSRQLDIAAQANLPLDSLANDFAVAMPAGLTLGQMRADVGLTGFIENPILEAAWDVSGGTLPANGRMRYGDQHLALQGHPVVDWRSPPLGHWRSQPQHGRLAARAPGY
jgi:hypothetical protein